MKKPLLTVSSLSFLLLLGVAGCAHQGSGGGAGYAGGAAFGDCEFGEDCYGPYDTQYTCVFVQAPSMPARTAIEPVGRHHPSPRVVNRDWTPGSPPTDSSGNSNAPSASASAPAPVAREPVVVASPAGESRSPRTPN